MGKSTQSSGHARMQVHVPRMRYLVYRKLVHSATASICPRAKAAVLSRSTAAFLELDDKIIVPEHIIRRRRPQLMPFRKADAAREHDPGIHKIRIRIASGSLGFACA
jgi:hypothetical protein